MQRQCRSSVEVVQKAVGDERKPRSFDTWMAREKAEEAEAGEEETITLHLARTR